MVCYSLYLENCALHVCSEFLFHSMCCNQFEIFVAPLKLKLYHQFSAFLVVFDLVGAWCVSHDFILAFRYSASVVPKNPSQSSKFVPSSLRSWILILSFLGIVVNRENQKFSFRNDVTILAWCIFNFVSSLTPIKLFSRLNPYCWPLNYHKLC